MAHLDLVEAQGVACDVHAALGHAEVAVTDVQIHAVAAHLWALGYRRGGE